MFRPAPVGRQLRPFAVYFVLLALMVPAMPAAAFAGPEFPFGQELLLDVRPMPGSKRVPSLEIRADGATAIDLWCNRVQGQIVVLKDTISILRGPVIVRQCTPERAQMDEELLSALLQVTTWKRQGDVVILEGATRLRFRISTN
jgi:heat shock protein HslJ